MAELQRRFESFVAANGLLPSGQRIIVAVSGGLDSIVLADLLARSKREVCLAHVNYGLRKHASDLDEQLVRTFAAKNELELDVLDASHLISSEDSSIQNRARSIRYQYFEALSSAKSAQLIAVAHHADDLAETVLFNTLRGTNERGLAPMPVSRVLSEGSQVTLVRPLRFAKRTEIRAYAEHIGLAWREDASNSSAKYSRSRLRHDVIPFLDRTLGFDPSATLVGMANAFELVNRNENCREGVDDIARGSDAKLNVKYLQQLNEQDRDRVIAKALQNLSSGEYPVTRHQVRRIALLLYSQPGRRAPMFGGQFIRSRTAIVFADAEDGLANAPEPLYPGSRVEWHGSFLSARTVETWSKEQVSSNSVFVDADSVSWPLEMRRWLPGDRFRPIGFASGTKKISDLLTDMKADCVTRHSVPVVVSGSDIVWVAGYRQSHRSRITDKTSRIVKLSYHGKNPDP